MQLANGTRFPFSYDSPVPDWVMQNQRHAYCASLPFLLVLRTPSRKSSNFLVCVVARVTADSAISYVDEHVGVLLGTLEEQNIVDNTIVIFHADHGYALGEHGYWEKKALFDLIVRLFFV